MNGNKEISLRLVRDRRARLQRNKSVVVARVDDVRAQPLFQQLAQAQSHVEHDIFFFDAAGAKQVIKQSDVDSKKKTGKSVMPDGLQGGLTPADFADLISYLETLRDKGPELPKKTTGLVPSFGSGRVSHSVPTRWSTRLLFHSNRSSFTVLRVWARYAEPVRSLG